MHYRFLNTVDTLALSDNSLSGWVPDGLADLKNLKVLTLGNNDLSGDLPKDVCKIKGIDVLSVDCDTQGCECCTECAPTPTAAPTVADTNSPTFAPTDAIVRFTPAPVATDFPTTSPTLSPTVSPTNSPTGSPTQCFAEISVIASCYAPSVGIELVLQNCKANRDDWVGVYPLIDTFDSQSLGNPEIWSWACGTRNCKEAVSENAFSVDIIHAGDAQWPMKPGTYVAVMARNSAMPYTAYGVSEPFTIAEMC